MTVVIEGLETTLAALDGAISKRSIKVVNQVQAGGLAVLTDVVNSIHNGSKSGKAYKRGNTIHIASADGEAPATDTGLLASSYTKVKTNNGLTAIVGSNLSYAGLLEFGTRNISPRPHLIPALEANREQIIQAIQKALR